MNQITFEHIPGTENPRLYDLRFDGKLIASAKSQAEIFSKIQAVYEQEETNAQRTRA